VELGEQPAQQAADAARGGPGARPQQRRHQVLHRLGAEGHRGHERQIAPRVVVAIEEGELLLPVGRIVGRIEVEGDEPDVGAQPFVVVHQHGVGQGAAQAIEVRPRHGVLEARQRRLRAQSWAIERIALEQQLVDRVVGQLGRVVAVGVAACQAEHALTDQVAEPMGDLAELPTVADGAGRPHRQAQPVVYRLHQHGAAVGTGVLIEAGHDRLGNPVDPKGAVRYTGCGHRASSFVCLEAPRHRFYSTGEWLGGPSLSSFANNPGLELK